MNHSAFVTIASLSHLHQAITAMNSLGPWNEHLCSRIYMLDSYFPDCKHDTHADILPLPEWISEWILTRLPSDYSLAELCFALKPLVLMHELNQGIESAHYIDSDLCFYSSPQGLINSALTHPICLTPHYLKPLPFGNIPSSLSLLRAGTFNGGYVSVANDPQAMDFLKWWSSCTSEHGYNAPKLGMCGDQRWLDLAPILFPGTHIIRDQGVNVAYWNLHERLLSTGDNGSLLCNHSPLIFFHYSGFDPNRPSLLSRFGHTPSAQNSQVLDDMCHRYATSLICAKRNSTSEEKIQANVIGRHFQSNRIPRLIRAVRGWIS